MPISLFFFSSAEISLPLFKALIKDPRFEIRALFCQIDKPAGRKMKLSKSPSKLMAERYSIPVYQTEKLSKETSLLSQFKNNPPDFLLTFAYGQILPSSWLDIPKKAPLNVHASLLPKYRGASPIQAAILNGEKFSGYSLMKMIKSMDAGPISHQKRINIPENMTAGKLHDEIANIVAEFVPEQINELYENLASFMEQDSSKVSFCYKIKRDDGFIDFQESAEKIYLKFRAYSPWPGIWTTFEGRRLKLLKIKVGSFPLPHGRLQMRNGNLYIGCGNSSIEIIKLQLEGKKANNAKDFCLGRPSFLSSHLPSLNKRELKLKNNVNTAKP